MGFGADSFLFNLVYMLTTQQQFCFLYMFLWLMLKVNNLQKILPKNPRLLKRSHLTSNNLP